MTDRVIYNRQKLEANGLTVEDKANGAMIATPHMRTNPQFVPIENGHLVLQTQRSAFHREIASAITGAPAPIEPERGDVELPPA